MTEELKISKNLSDDIVTFENKEEFFKYYEEHKEDVDKMKTRGLNIKYKIPGFKIGRKKEQLVLIQLKKKQEEVKEEPKEEVKEDVKEEEETPKTTTPEQPKLNKMDEHNLIFDIIARLDKLEVAFEKNFQLLEAIYLNIQSQQVDSRSCLSQSVNMNERPSNQEVNRFNNSFRGFL